MVLNKLGSFTMSTDLSNVRMKGEDLFMFKSRVKCHKMENLTWASSRILWKEKKHFRISSTECMTVKTHVLPLSAYLHFCNLVSVHELLADDILTDA